MTPIILRTGLTCQVKSDVLDKIDKVCNNTPMKCRIGEIHGRLTVLEAAEPWIDGSPVWLCSCSCGEQVKKKEVYFLPKGSALRLRSCGCVQKAQRAELKAEWKVRDLLKELRLNPAYKHYVRSSHSKKILVSE